MVYNYTVPRVPCMASYGSSPGPKYGLPGLIGQRGVDPRSVHEKRPAWPFGIKAGRAGDQKASPGPKYLVGPYTRYGSNGAPHYSIYGRPQDMKSFRIPGPGAYSPEKHTSTYHAYPAYSLGSRQRSRRSDDTPGPNRYSLPNMIGKTVQAEKRSAPAYTQTGRSKTGSFHEDLSRTPGPGTYKTTNPDIYKDALPKFSMTGRHSMPGDTTTKPGPGAHSPENVYVTDRQAPIASFGIKHSEYICPLIECVAE